MRFKVVLVSLILLAFFIGAVSAADITNYNSPIGFERDPMTFVNGDFEMEMEGTNILLILHSAAMTKAKAKIALNILKSSIN